MNRLSVYDDVGDFNRIRPTKLLHVLSIVCVLASLLSHLPALAQEPPPRAGITVTIDPVEINAEGYDREIFPYAEPALPPTLTVKGSGLPAYQLQLSPELLFLQKCTYGGSLTIWRLQGQVMAVLTDAVSGQQIAAQVFLADVPAGCESSVSILQLADHISWPPESLIIEWLVSVVPPAETEEGGLGLNPITNHPLIPLAELGTVKLAEAVGDFAFMPDSRLFLTGASWESIVRLWDVSTLEETASADLLPGENGNSIYAAAISPDGNQIAVSAAPFHNILRILDAHLAETLFELPVESSIERLAFSPDGALLAAVNYKTVTLWDMSTGVISLSFELSPPVRTIVFSPDGATLLTVTGDDETAAMIAQWNVRTGELVSNTMLTTPVSHAVMSPDGTLLAVAPLDEGNLGRIDIITPQGELVISLTGHTDSVYSLAFNPAGTMLASASGDRTVRLWNIETGNSQNISYELPVYQVIATVFFSPDGTILGGGTSWRDAHPIVILWYAAE